MRGGALPATFAGAHVHVDDAPLAAALPLQPGASVTLPVTVHVGRAPADAFDEVNMEVTSQPGFFLYLFALC
jgi:hypothetical protein